MALGGLEADTEGQCGCGLPLDCRLGTLLQVMLGAGRCLLFSIGRPLLSMFSGGRPEVE